MSRAFLIGAGATRAQYEEAPLSDDFFKILGHRRNSIKRELFLNIKKTIQSDLKAPLEDSNVEDVMKRSYEFPQSNRTSFLESLHSAIYELLANPTESTEGYIKAYVNGEIIRPPTLFKTLLNDPRLNENDFFMTLNYDLYLDREVLSIQRKIDYGIEKEVINTNRLPLFHEPIFSVYHLHGSLNWEVVRDNRINLQWGAISPRYTRSGSNLCLVPPGKKEFEFPPIIESIWRTAEERLLQADELIIIGCSLNPNDAELTELIKKFVKEKGANNVKIIYLYDPSKSDIDANYFDYKKIIGDGFKKYPHGFIISGTNGFNRFGAIEFIFD